MNSVVFHQSQFSADQWDDGICKEISGTGEYLTLLITFQYKHWTMYGGKFYKMVPGMVRCKGTRQMHEDKICSY